MGDGFGEVADCGVDAVGEVVDAANGSDEPHSACYVVGVDDGTACFVAFDVEVVA